MRLSVPSAVLAVALALAATGSELSAQRDDWVEECRRERDWDDRRVRHCEVREVGMRPTGRPLRVDGGQNGGAIVDGWTRDSIVVRALIQTQARTEEDARELAREIRIDVSEGTIRADGPPGRRSASWSVTFEVSVPRRTDLELEAHNGPVSVEGVSGRLELHTVNGPLTVAGVSGDVRGRTQNGPVHVELEGTQWEGTGLDVSTANGPVHLTIPRGYNARLETGTVNGPMHINFPVTVQGRLDRRITTELGSGGRTIRVVTTNGPVTVRQR